MSKHAMPVFDGDMAIQFGVEKSFASATFLSTKVNVHTHKLLPLIKGKMYWVFFNNTAYTNKSLYKCPPGTTEYFSKSVMPSAASTCSSIKVLPVHWVDGLDKI